MYNTITQYSEAENLIVSQDVANNTRQLFEQLSGLQLSCMGPIDVKNETGYFLNFNIGVQDGERTDTTIGVAKGPTFEESLVTILGNLKACSQNGECTVVVGPNLPHHQRHAFRFSSDGNGGFNIRSKENGRGSTFDPQPVVRS